MNPILSWLLIGGVAAFIYYAIDHFETMEWRTPEWSSDSEALILVTDTDDTYGSVYIRVPFGHVRCPRCNYFQPKDTTDPVTGLCGECTYLAALDEEIDWDEWAALRRALDDEARDNEDHL